MNDNCEECDFFIADKNQCIKTLDWNILENRIKDIVKEYNFQNRESQIILSIDMIPVLQECKRYKKWKEENEKR